MGVFKKVRVATGKAPNTERNDNMNTNEEKKPLLDSIYKMNFYCPNCEEFLVTKGQKQIPHCRYCNQRISWEGESWDENMYKM